MEENQNSPSTEEIVPTPTQEIGEPTETTEEASAEPTETSSESTEDTTEDSDGENDGKKTGKGFEKRIERFNRRLAEKEAEIEHWRKAALQSNQPAPQTLIAPQPDQTKPKFTDYNDIEAYTEAVTEWKLQQRDIAQKQQNLNKTYAEKEQALRASDPEYDEVISDFKQKYRHVNAPEINQFIAESDIGPNLFYHLANNTAEIDRILALPPLRRVAELGKLEAKLSAAESAPQVNKISKAPAPVSKEKGVAPTVKRLDDPNLSQAEYRQLRMQNKRRY